MPDNTHQVTQAIAAAVPRRTGGGRQAVAVVYDDLKALARARMGRVPPGNTLQPTALVHEAYMRLIGGLSGEDPGWEGRRTFRGPRPARCGTSWWAARRKAGPKAGGGRKREGLGAFDDEQTPPIDSPVGVGESVVALSKALGKLEELDPRKAEVVLLKFFTGLDHEQIGKMLGMSVPTVERDWRFARSWLSREMQSELPE